MATYTLTRIENEIKALTAFYWEIANGTPAYVARRLGIVPSDDHSHRGIKIRGILHHPGGRPPLRISVTDSSYDGAVKKIQWDCILQINEWILDKEAELKKATAGEEMQKILEERPSPFVNTELVEQATMATFTTKWIQHLFDNGYEVRLHSRSTGLYNLWEISIMKPKGMSLNYSRFGSFVECLASFKEMWEIDRKKMEVNEQ